MAMSAGSLAHEKTLFWPIVLVLAAGGLAVFYYHRFGRQPAPPVAVAEKEPGPREEPERPLIRYPIPEPEQKAVKKATEQPADPVKSLPVLDESDPIVEQEFGSLFGAESFAALFNVNNIIWRMVVAVDNLPRRQVPQRYSPVKPVAGRFRASGAEGNQYLSPDNYQRYTAYVEVLEAVDAENLVAAYVHLYPLFQQAYQELGYPNAYFNDRLVAAIDDMLATPEVKGPIMLIRPSVMFKFADPALEALSAGQKILIRMGPGNAARVKTKLREFRRVLMARVVNRS